MGGGEKREKLTIGREDGRQIDELRRKI